MSAGFLIIGNSSSGKSTLARRLSRPGVRPYLDLDTVAWPETEPPTRKFPHASEPEISAFVDASKEWVIEGCYGDLIELAQPFSTELIFVNPPVETCLTNARQRPWKSHKYESKKAQDANLPMLLDWIERYPTREDSPSEKTHTRLFDRYPGKKTKVASEDGPS